MKSIRLSLVLIVFFGLGYPLLMTGFAQLFFPKQANGSMVQDDNHHVLGSKLIGQNFQSPKYFHGRISSIDYNAAGSGSNNYAPSNEKMIQRTEEASQKLLAENPDKKRKDIPLDLITNSGSGLDPHISPQGAFFQVARVARENNLPEKKVEELVRQHIEGEFLNLFGQAQVNVLQLNLALQKMVKGERNNV